MNIFFYFSAFILGAGIGSFLWVIVLRFDKKEQFVCGRSKCPVCGHILKWQENVPLLSFIFLRGHCSACHKKISLLYPLTELMAGLLFMLALYLTFHEPVTMANHLAFYYFITLLLYYFITFSFLLLIFLFDYQYLLIPDKISLPAIIAVAFFQLVLTAFLNFSPNFLIPNFLFLIFSAIIISSFFAAQYFFSRGRWVGGGDIRLGFLIGLILGWPKALAALGLAYLLGLCYALPVLILKKKNLKSQIPFGVFLTTATLITMAAGEQIINWYLSFFK